MSENELTSALLKLDSIIWLTAFFSFVLICVLILSILKVRQKGSLDQYRSSKAGFADLLNYSCMVDDGIIALKNGALMRAWQYKGPDDSMIEVHKRNYIEERLNDMMLQLDHGWVLHVDCVRSQVPKYFAENESFFPNKVAEGIDEERRQRFNGENSMYNGFFIITATWFPPTKANQKLNSLMYSKDGSEELSEHENALQIIEEFKEKSSIIETGLTVAFETTLKPLKSHREMQENGSYIVYDDLLQYLNFCISGEWHKVILPLNPIEIDMLLAQDMQKGLVPVVGDKYVKVIAFDSLPAVSSPGIFNVLTELGSDYRWNTRFICMDKTEAEANLNKRRKFWAGKKQGFISAMLGLPGRINQYAVDMCDEADLAISAVTSGKITYGAYSSNIILMNRDYVKLKKQTRQVIEELQRLGIKPREEGINCMSAWLGTLPSHAVENIRRPIISTFNFVDLIPLFSPWSGELKAPCPMVGYGKSDAPAVMMTVTGKSQNTPFALNLHVGDLGHTMILGPSGAGKSTLLATLVAQYMRYRDMTIFSFDKGMSMYCLCKATGGDHYIPAGEDSTLSFAPLSSIKNDADRAWANDWLSDILELNGIKPTTEMKDELDNAIVSMLQAKEFDANYNMSFSSFLGLIQDNQMRSVYQQYCKGSSFGTLFDSISDGFENLSATLSVFEIEHLMNLKDAYKIPVLSYLFHCIERNLHGQPALIVLDEAWIMLGNPVFSQKIREWLKVLRKANCAVIMATQSLSDIANSSIMDVLIENCATNIFLPNENAISDEASALYKKFGLNQAQIELISKGVKKRDYLFYNKAHSRMFRLALDPFTLAFVAVSDKESIAEINKLIDEHGKDWVDFYIAKKGLVYPQEKRKIA